MIELHGWYTQNARKVAVALEECELPAGLPADTLGLNSYLVHTRAPAPHFYAVERFVGEARRLIGVLNEHLRGHRFVARDYSIADIAIHAWIRSAWTFLQGGGLGAIEELRPLVDWKLGIDERPPVVRALRRMQEPEARSAEEVA